MSKLLRKFKQFEPYLTFTRNQSRIFNKIHLDRKPDRSGPLKWVVLTIPVASFGLGCWQVQRLQWKKDLIKSVTDKTTNEPVELPEDLSELESMEFIPVKVSGRFLHNREILLGPRAYLQGGGESPTPGSLVSNPKTNQGWLVITPFQLQNRNEIILVNRGWVPKSMKDSSNRMEGQIEGDIELTGLVRKHENRPPFVPKNNPAKGYWYYRDLEEMAHLTGAQPVMLDARGPDDMPKGWPLPNQSRITFRNEHLSYLATWFSLSGFTGWLWFRNFIQRIPIF